jgi:hypothetical protein
MFIAAVFTVAKLWKPYNWWMDHEIVEYTHNGVLGTRNNDVGFDGKWIQLKDIMLREVSQDQKNKKHMFSLMHGRQIQR